MKFIHFLPFLALFTFSCSNVEKLNFNELETIFFDYDSHQPNNYFSEINARICAKTIYGQIIPLKKKGLQIGKNVAYNFSKENVIVEAPPRDFNDSLIFVDFVLTKSSGEQFKSMDTLQLNYRKGLTFKSIAKNGAKGMTGTDGSTALLFRFGKDGSTGQHGQNGAKGDCFTLHIWKEKDIHYIQLSNTTKSTSTHYQIRGWAPFSITSIGGNGGEGGDGGMGGDGKNGEINGSRIKEPGKGGDGGAGGNGGNGGDGGDFACFIHPSASAFQSQLNFISQPGNSGSPGKGGAPGKSGIPEKDQTDPGKGTCGVCGNNGHKGQHGKIDFIIESFAIE